MKCLVCKGKKIAPRKFRDGRRIDARCVSCLGTGEIPKERVVARLKKTIADLEGLKGTNESLFENKVSGALIEAQDALRVLIDS